MKKVETYRDHEIFEDDSGSYWIVKGPVVDDILPWEFFPYLKDVKGFIDDIIDEKEGGEDVHAKMD